jgi:hypothetical protein
MQPQIQPDFDRFLMRVLTGEEFEIYSVQRDELINTPPSQGEHDLVIETEKRYLRYTIYVSHVLEVIFFLAGHIERKGEPREKDVKTLKQHIAKIKELEAYYADDSKD